MPLFSVEWYPSCIRKSKKIWSREKLFCDFSLRKKFWWQTKKEHIRTFKTFQLLCLIFLFYIFFCKLRVHYIHYASFFVLKNVTSSAYFIIFRVGLLKHIFIFSYLFSFFRRRLYISWDVAWKLVSSRRDYFGQCVKTGFWL